MPTLDWIGKKAVVKHHKDVPYRLLEPIKKLSYGDTGSGNLIVQGDNLHALKALLPRYAGKVKCIYIDPPYNKGNEGWVYNDNVNSPEIQKWLNEVVGKEGEDLSRHDKWLCMMYPRLVLLKQFMSNDGVIFVSIDDNELANLLLTMREIFGKQNEVATIIWEKGKKGDSKLVSITHEYMAVFARNKNYFVKNNIRWRKRKEGADEVLAYYDELKIKHKGIHTEIRKKMMAWYRSLSKKDPRKAHKHYNWSDNRGLYFAADFAGPDDGRENRPRYNIPHPRTGKPCVIPSTGWRWEEKTTMDALKEDPARIHFGKDHTTIPNRKTYLYEIDTEPLRSVFYKDGRAATLEVEAILGAGAFQFPKDSEIIAELIGLVTDDNDLVLDSFAGSGTTGHAVLKRNHWSDKNLNFILVEMDEEVAINKTSRRLMKAIDGFIPITNGSKTEKKEKVEGLGGGFQFCRLSKEPLFDTTGAVREDVTFAQLAEFVWFVETGTGFFGKANSPLIGIHENRAIYLLFNGILKDRSVNGGNVLTGPILSLLPKHDGLKVIYAAACRLGSARLARENIVFKQTPYELEV